jgi:hypothetical protein
MTARGIADWSRVAQLVHVGPPFGGGRSIKRGAPISMNASPSETDEVMRVLASTPRRLRSMVKGMPAARLDARPDVDEWSANEILAHLCACADVWGTSILRMIQEDHPTIRYQSPRSWIRKTDYLDRDFHTSLVGFSTQRARLLRELRALDPPAWLRSATFTGTSRWREATILDYTRRIANHEQGHMEQIGETLRGVPD